MESYFSSQDLASLICEYRGKGHQLRYDEYSILQSWIEASGNDTNRLALILEDIFPEWIAKNQGKSQAPHLKNVHKMVLTRLRR